MGHSPIPRWVRWVGALVLTAQLVAVVVFASGKLLGPSRNVVFQVLLGGLIALLALAAYVWRYHPDAVPPPPTRIGIGLLTLLAFGLVLLYLHSIRDIVRMPYDLGSWSEPMMVNDIIKLRTGTPLYLPPEDSNSSVYTPGAPAVTYFLAWLFQHPTSIPFYRLIQQAFLLLAAVLAAAAARDLVRLADPKRLPRWPGVWLLFFFFASYLLATGSPATTFNVYLHNDPLALLVSGLAFWLMVRHAVTHDSRWLWLMAVAPSAGYLVKQMLAIWAVCYVLYLWLDGSYPRRRVLMFGLTCFGVLVATIALCFLVWGSAFRYWIFQVMGTHIVSPLWIVSRFAEAAMCLLLGLLGGWILLKEQAADRLLGIWTAWLVLLVAGLYTSGITYHPTHLASATMVGGCLALAALALLWPDSMASAASPSFQWHHMIGEVLIVLTLFAGLGFTRQQPLRVTPDLARYTQQVEQEFDGLSAERVLLDTGDWIYLPRGLVMKDRSPMLLTHRVPYYSALLGRIRQHSYARILVHQLPDGVFWYDIGLNRGIGNALLSSYHEVRRIPRVRGMESWLYYNMMMSDVVVLEPNTTGHSNTPASDLPENSH